jgi:hypothetical protein
LSLIRCASRQRARIRSRPCVAAILSGPGIDEIDVQILEMAQVPGGKGGAPDERDPGGLET